MVNSSRPHPRPRRTRRRGRRAVAHTQDAVGRLVHGCAGYLGTAWFWLEARRHHRHEDLVA